ncbi:DUF1549 domain-containing protein [Anatilimnocola aggregata]|nr:DUF1549 domain-containing protein [Anatilimnocola aggregata]
MMLLAVVSCGVAVCAAEPAVVGSISASIDREIATALKSRALEPAPRATDGELVRRIYLDLLGRIPTPTEIDAFHELPGSDRSHGLIDALLAHEEFPVYWRGVFDDWLNGGALERDFGREGFLQFLQTALTENRPWNEIARQLLAPDVTREEERGSAYFLALRLRGDGGERLDNMTMAVATGLFGLQLQCAKCHDHPFVDELKQDHYYGLAAFFGRTQEAKYREFPLVKERAEGEVSFTTKSKEEKSARLLFLDNHEIAEPERPTDKNAWYVKGSDGLPDAPYFSRRQALAEYALRADSAYFKRALVNRVWKQLLGRGLVEPVDQMHTANPATHPAVLDLLADDFAASGFDIRRLMAAILHSETYLRSTRWETSGELPRAGLYAVGVLKPLSPEQLVLSMHQASGSLEPLRAKVARELKDQTPLAIAVRMQLGRDRDWQDFAQRFRNQSEGFEATAAQALFLSYHSLASKPLQPRQGNLVERLIKQKDDEAAVREAYRNILCRAPTEQELLSATDFLKDSSTKRETLAWDLAWALLCSAEFRFNY